jgi:spermidine synthase
LEEPSKLGAVTTAEGTPRSAPGPAGVRVFFLGFLTLFVELLLIRWLAGNIWNLSYFPNFVLLAVFVGMALGFVFHRVVSERWSPWVFQSGLGLLALLAAVVTFARPAVPGFERLEGSVGGELYFTAAPVVSQESSLLFFAIPFVLIVVMFSCISQRTAKAFSVMAPLRAYTCDIAGSIAGILSFMVLSAVRAPAWVWFLCLLPLAVAADGWAGRAARLLPLVPIALCASLSVMQDSVLTNDPRYDGPLRVSWSPYQKVEFVNSAKIGRTIFVNGIRHQEMFPPDNLKTAMYSTPHARRRSLGLPPYRNVLVIGAGSGNDVAAALANGVEHVDAVEIDPVIAGLGREFHEARAYADPRVSLVVDDGRAFMTRTRRRYGLIIFALTDSIVKVSSMSQLRLENYIFTTESVRRAWNLLADDGDFVMYNFYRKTWLMDKFAAMLRQATGRDPQVLMESGDFRMTMVGRSAVFQPASKTGDNALDVATDDWPFPYLRARGVPTLYAVALAFFALFAAILLLGLGRVSDRGPIAAPLVVKLAFLLSGAAFLLLETKSIVQFSLLFGTTWVNSSLVFLAVLLSVLCANWLALLFHGSRALWITGALLVGTCLVGYLYPLGNLLSVESATARFLAASAVTFSPILLANLLFSMMFRDQAGAERLFGWNLFGATLGGLVEYASMAVGYSGLAIIVVALYLLVIALFAAHLRRAPARAR